MSTLNITINVLTISIYDNTALGVLDLIDRRGAFATVSRTYGRRADKTTDKRVGSRKTGAKRH